VAYCDAVAAEAARFVEAVRDLDLAARVPTCPDWSVKDLMEHMGTVHRWCAGMVSVLAPARMPSAEMELGMPWDPGELPDWISTGGAYVVETLRDSPDPDAPMWGWGSDKHVRFWSRRMLHETAVHRADAEFAAGLEPSIEPGVAVDGIDEFLDNLPHARRFAPHVADLHGSGQRLLFRAIDASAAWTVTLEEGRFAWDHSGDGAEVTVEGAASDLVLFIYGRYKPDDSTRFKVSGDRDLLEFWRERSSI
jgi:uncharacterized protein (TIGR03083 family)